MPGIQIVYVYTLQARYSHIKFKKTTKSKNTIAKLDVLEGSQVQGKPGLHTETLIQKKKKKKSTCLLDLSKPLAIEVVSLGIWVWHVCFDSILGPELQRIICFLTAV